MCQSHVSAIFPRFYALTGWDSTSSISQLGKRNAWIVLKHSTYHQKALSLFVQQQYLDETILRKTEAFIRDLHPKTRKSTRTMDELQYLRVKCLKEGASTNFGQFEATPLAPIQVWPVRRQACAWRTKYEKSHTLQRSNVCLVTQSRSQIFMTWRKTGKTE